MGRPKQFDYDQVLEKAAETFWRNGYDATTTDHLEANTGLKRGSLYHAFGDKRGLYLAALDYYARTEMADAIALLGRYKLLSEGVLALFEMVIAQAGPIARRRGCLLCDAAIEQAIHDPEIGLRVRAAIDPLRLALQERLKSEKTVGTAQDARSRADQVVATYMGLRVLAKAGYPDSVLQNVAKQTALDLKSV